MLDLSKVCLLAVDTKYPDLALWSLRRNLAKARFGQTVLVTSKEFAERFVPIHALDKQVSVHATDSVNSVADYSRFMIMELKQFVEADYVLVVQWDSFIICPEHWEAEFFSYDYIGSLWRKKAGRYRVGNGGFSLRSKALVKAVAALSPTQTHPEDVVIGRTLRKQLEDEFKLRFPEDAVAQRFAFERSRPLAPSFGFHRFANFPLVLSRNELSEFLALAPDALVTKRGVFRFVRNACSQGMHDIARGLVLRRSRAGNGNSLSTVLLLAWCFSAGSLAKAYK